MKKIWVLSAWLLGIILLTGFLQPLIGFADNGTPSIIINELAWAGSSSNWRDEWIELKNTTDTEIDIAGWQITYIKGDSNEETLMLEIIDDIDNPQNTVILANEYFLIAHNAQNHNFGDEESPILSVLNIEPDYIDNSITLSNTNLSIKLYDGSWDNDGNLIDIAGNGNIPLAGSNSAKTSMERNEVYASGDLIDSWHESTLATNLDDAIFDKATPKSLNSPKLLPAPKVISISPIEANIETVLEIEEIVGENFVVELETQIKIVKDSDFIFATDVHVASSTIIDDAKFNLSGAIVGQWDLIIINPDGQEGILLNAITITEPEEDIIYSNQIIISELYPKPDTTSNDEFIELHNKGTSSVNLNKWKLDDMHPGGSMEYLINQNLIIGGGEYMIFSKPQTHISLNDTGDYVRLIQPDGNVLDETPNYGSAQKGWSYSFVENNWQWSLRTTPNSQNILEVPEEEEDIEDLVDLSDMEIILDYDDMQTESVTLLWNYNLTNITANVSIYQSNIEENLGNLTTTTLLSEKLIIIDNLEPNTTYFFTLALSYNENLIKSNQIEITTLDEILNNIGYFKQVIVTEILPNPDIGDDEFIELYNPTEETVNIAGWRLMDASSRSYTINSLDLPPITITTLQNNSVLLGSGQYIVLEQSTTGLHLNNSGGEELYLLDTQDNIIDSVTYAGNAKRGYVYALAPNDKWFWSDEITAGAENDISFAGIIGDSTEYLTASGVDNGFSLAGLISLLLSVIIFILIRRYGYPSYK